MDILDALNSAARFAAAQWQVARREGREEDARLWMRVNEFRAFVGETGQLYRLEAYVGQGVLPVRPLVSASLAARGDTVSHRVVSLLSRVFDAATGPQHQQSAFILMSLIHFLAETGQLEAVEDYVNHRLQYAPLAIARFMTLNDAKQWVDALAVPLSPVRLLVGDAYFLAWWSREDNDRGLHRDYVIEPYIEELAARGVSAAAPDFQTHEDAHRWLAGHPACPFAFVSIGGEYQVAVHHKRLSLHTLHPVAASLREWGAVKSAAEKRAARESSEEENEGGGEP